MAIILQKSEEVRVYERRKEWCAVGQRVIQKNKVSFRALLLLQLELVKDLFLLLIPCMVPVCVCAPGSIPYLTWLNRHRVSRNSHPIPHLHAHNQEWWSWHQLATSDMHVHMFDHAVTPRECSRTWTHPGS